jgi:glycosyltransferase involved in cell wall biosynthesis
LTDSVVIAGPASPRALARWLSKDDRNSAREIPALGGSVVNNLVEALLGAGVQVELLTLAPELDERVTLDGSDLRILIGSYRSKPRERAKDMFRAERREVAGLLGSTSSPVVHVQWTYEFALGALAAAAPRRPTLLTAQDAPLTILRYDTSRYRAMRTLMAYVARARRPILSANSPYLAAAWRRQLLYRRSIPVIPNVVQPVSQTGRTGDNVVVLDVTDAGKRKNPAALVHALPAVRASHPEAQLRLAGPGLDEQSPLADLARQLGVFDAIDLVGPLDQRQLHHEYSQATIFAHASLEESFGMTVAEAMSHGLPIVAGARAGAVPWVLDDGRAGVLVDAQKPSELAAGINHLLASESVREELSTAAIKRAAEVFSPAAVAVTAIQIYEELRENRL